MTGEITPDNGYRCSKRLYVSGASAPCRRMVEIIGHQVDWRGFDIVELRCDAGHFTQVATGEDG